MPIRQRLVILLLAIGLSIAALQGASAAAPLDDALARLAADSFAETEKAIAEIAASGAPTAEAILAALADRRLFLSAADKAVYFKDKDGRHLRCRTGSPVADVPADLSLVRVNNRLRGQIEAALGLDDASVARCRQAPGGGGGCIQVAERGRTCHARRRARQGDRHAREARARELRAAPSCWQSQTRRSASRWRPSRCWRSAPTRRRWPCCAVWPLPGGPELEAAADAAIETVERRLFIVGLMQNIWYGLSLGSVLLLASIGLAITFGVMGVINMAHGEMVMIGAYTTFVVQEAFRTMAPGWFDWSLPIAIPLAFLVAALVGIAIERGIVRFLYAPSARDPCWRPGA